MARARFSAYKSSITNRTGESGGSLGGNDKAGLVNLWYWSMVPVGTVRPRLPGACCRDPVLSLANVKPMPKPEPAPGPAPGPAPKPQGQGYYFKE